MPRRVAAIALLLCTAAAAIGPIRSYDFFWHLATGRWILEHRALPLYDPFALASARVPWINGEWLWQVILAIESLVGFRGISWLNAIFVGVMFTIAWWFASRDSDRGAALLLTTIAFAGAAGRLGIRPAEAAALLIIIAVALLASRLPPPRLAIAYALLTIVWINTHPSALLAPILAATTLLIDFRRWVVVASSAVALLINPFGWRAIAAPFALTTLIARGSFVNAEWLPSLPATFPLLYLTIAAAVVAFWIDKQKREHLWRFLIFALLAVLAIAHVRDQGLYFAAFPLVFVPLSLPRRTSVIAAGLAIVPLIWIAVVTSHMTGIDPEYFPVRAVAQLQRMQLRGNIYNADRFGGYLEWTFYPQRRVVTDGRNELFANFIAEDTRAHADSRAWNALLREYAIDIAVDKYDPRPVRVLDVSTGRQQLLPLSVVRYRRDQWALVAFDDAAMIFARRAAFPPAIIARYEYRFLIPDAPQVHYANAAILREASAEVQRARREIGEENVVRKLEAELAAN